MRGGIENSLAAREKVRTSRASIAGRNQMHVRAIDIHRVDLIALMTLARRLKDEFLAVSRKVGFRIFTAKGQLLHVAQMLFLWQSEIWRLSRGALVIENGERRQKQNEHE